MISLDEMSALATALVDADAGVEEQEEKLKQAKEHARTLREETIPSAMQELGLESLSLSTGQKLSVVQEVYASIPANNKSAAYQWLDSNGFGGLIKVEVSTKFAKGEKDAAVELYKELSERGLEMDLEESVHAQTLKAFLKEQLAKGNAELPLDLFGARPVWCAKISKK